MELTERLSSTDVEFPFGTLPDTDEAKAWSMELDFVDVWEGPIEELEELARTAPTPTAAGWLWGVIHTRKMMRNFADWPPARPKPDTATAEAEHQRQTEDARHEAQQQAAAAPAPKKKSRRRTPEM